ncbi:phosphoadenylyl-sulfate reductase [Hymenobacter lapidiphilus]|uniref:Adenosine 5'-phosphosulfate reductase n=1 Tax=Hymenobacter lapidiphilus TaxID=2608003 RepID=A0A7Y7PRD9_9BACT|nr:phosphoadenylyl-sulfate reductase [Hymenobacter lapidiphilus]NVO32297.1 phosphoadenylyl-sulfate reductase [Hymenobacter lapidiphilus]
MHLATEALVDDLRRYLVGQSVSETLTLLAEHFPGTASFSTSFGLEDQIITHFIFENDLPIRVFTLDTGRNFQETYATWNKTLLRYAKPIEVFAPQAASVEQLLLAKGPNSFYESIENRKQCCHIRKLEPLGRALAGQKIWVTGIRAEQSANRQIMYPAEWDAAHQLIKVHPVFDWTWEQCHDVAQQHGIPVNPLHQQGFVSIGCAPCTRAIRPGEDFRAGRWWWEDQVAKECGLHATAPSQGLDPVAGAGKRSD